MPPSPHAPPDQSQLARPAETVFNNPFASEDFGKRFDEAYAKDQALENPAARDSGNNKPTDTTGSGTDQKIDPIKEPAAGVDVKAVTIPELKDAKAEPSNKAFAEMRTKIKALESELEKRSTNAPDASLLDLQKKLDALTKERDQFSEKLMQVGIERHPEFNSKYNGQLDQAIATAREIVGDEAADKVETILRMAPGKQRQAQIEAIAADLSPYQLNALASVDLSTRQIIKERDAILSKPKESFTALMEQEKAVHEAQQQRNLQVFEETMKTAASPDEGMFVFREREGDTAWNEQVAKRRELAKNIFRGGMAPDQLARAAAWATAAPELAEQLQVTAKQLAEARSEIESLKAASPKLEPGGGREKMAAQAESGDYTEGVLARALEVFPR